MPGLAHFCEHLLFMVQVDMFVVPLTSTSRVFFLRAANHTPVKMTFLRYRITTVTVASMMTDILFT